MSVKGRYSKMNRLKFIKRFSIGVLACSMMREALFSSSPLDQLEPGTVVAYVDKNDVSNTYYGMDIQEMMEGF